MIIYNVTVNIDVDAHDNWYACMQEVHIPEVMETGLFLEAKMSRILAEEEGGMSYAIQYLCADMQTYEQYQTIYAPKLQQAHSSKFAGKFVAFRTLLKVEKSFSK